MNVDCSVLELQWIYTYLSYMMNGLTCQRTESNTIINPFYNNDVMCLLRHMRLKQQSHFYCGELWEGLFCLYWNVMSLHENREAINPSPTHTKEE